MNLQEETDKAIEEYNGIIDEQDILKKQFDDLEQKRLVAFGQVQALSELLSKEKAKEQEAPQEKPKAAPKSNKAAK